MFTTRFAPSPTGYLHLGHAYSALLAYDAAHRVGGQFILRIEDIDIGRCKPGFEAAIFEDLAWLGVDWCQPVRRQSEHLAQYQARLDKLIELGVVYRCFKTRKEVLLESASASHGLSASNAPSAPYVGQALTSGLEEQMLMDGTPFAWRLSVAACKDYLGPVWRDLACLADGVMTKIEPERLGDVVIARKEFPTSYHLASVTDDAIQGITHVIRGQDLSEAIHIHVLLQALLELPTPVYQHHPLILDQNGNRLAKRDKAKTLRDMRGQGVTPTQIRLQIGLHHEH